jgi:hypothetical protein
MPYGDIVPLEFQRLSRYASHEFRVRDAWRRPYRYLWSADGQPEAIPKAAFCRVMHQGKLQDAVFPESAHAGAFEAVMLRAAAHEENTRPGKFLTAFRAVECLEVKPELEMRSIRHSLAHSTTQLRDPAVTAALRQMFAGLSIDFRKHSHRREFYRWLGDLLVLLDCSLAAVLLAHRDRWLAVSPTSLLAPYEEDAQKLDHV